MSGAPALDWSLGRYERTAEQLLPAARLVVERAAPRVGERVVDVGCGSGNAALLAAERGARVTGVDPAARLLDVAREEAAARGLDADFALAEAAALPLADGEADVVLSVFGLIFAPDPQAAAAELDRVTAPSGRIVLSAWIPGGGMSDAIRVSREAVARVLELPPGPQPFASLGGTLADAIEATRRRRLPAPEEAGSGRCRRASLSGLQSCPARLCQGGPRLRESPPR